MSHSPDLTRFRIQTPADGGNYRFSLGKVSVSSDRIRPGILKLFGELGIINHNELGADQQLLAVLKNYPETYERTILLNILESPFPKSDGEVASKVLDEEIVCFNPLLPLEPVTPFSSIPVKPHSLCRGQLTLENLFIEKAIKDAINNGSVSTRGIAKSLGEQGVLVSHMTISRRLKTLKG